MSLLGQQGTVWEQTTFKRMFKIVSKLIYYMYISADQLHEHVVTLKMNIHVDG